VGSIRMAEPTRDHGTIDVLDRVLDKGIVIDGWWKISVGGISLMTIDGRIIVASIETYLRHAPVLARTDWFPWPELEAARRPASVAPPPPAPVKRRPRSR
jgi:hypothetical protein